MSSSSAKGKDPILAEIPTLRVPRKDKESIAADTLPPTVRDPRNDCDFGDDGDEVVAPSPNALILCAKLDDFFRVLDGDFGGDSKSSSPPASGKVPSGNTLADTARTPLPDLGSYSLTPLDVEDGLPIDFRNCLRPLTAGLGLNWTSSDDARRLGFLYLPGDPIGLLPSAPEEDRRPVFKKFLPSAAASR